MSSTNGLTNMVNNKPKQLVETELTQEQILENNRAVMRKIRETNTNTASNSSYICRGTGFTKFTDNIIWEDGIPQEPAWRFT